MTDSSKRSLARKPGKLDANWRIKWGLHTGFPLFPHQSGRWAKKVRGKLVYFGKIADDPKGAAAAQLWAKQKDDLIAGRVPRDAEGSATIGLLCDRFRQNKESRVESGELSRLTLIDYVRTCDLLVTHFGKNRPLDDLTSDDFEILRRKLARTRGPVALGNSIRLVRIVLKYGVDEGLITRSIPYGQSFEKPSKSALRKAKIEKGEKLIDAASLRKLIDAADVQLRAMILLGINCGFGNSDCGTLPLSALDLDGGWVNYPRPKTGVKRRCPLWSETVAALRAAIAERPTPKATGAEKLVFVTRRGAAWAKDTADNPLTKEFRKLLGKLDLHRPGLGFYTLRHVFRTEASGAKDLEATRAIMGHGSGHVEEAYIERLPDDARLKAVADHVRAWLYPPDEGEQDGSAEQPAAVPMRGKQRKAKPTRGDAAARADGCGLKIVG